MKIAFVCEGNTCRSALAHHFMEKLVRERGLNQVQVDSFGVAGDPGLTVPRMVHDLLREEGVPSVHHVSKPMSRRLVEESDLILVMEERHREFILRELPEARGKVHLLRSYAGLKDPVEIRDPICGPHGIYDKTFCDIKEALLKIVSKLEGK